MVIHLISHGDCKITYIVDKPKTDISLSWICNKFELVWATFFRTSVPLKKLKRYQYERYAVLCKLAYPPTLDHVALGFSSRGHKPIYNRQGHVIARVLWQQSKKEVIVVFRGSQSIGDWLINLCFIPKRINTSSVTFHIHFGYHYLVNQKGRGKGPETTCQNSVFEQIELVLKPLIANGKRITLTGHSSGGAMAVLVADKLERMRSGTVKRVVTFGQPSTGLRSFHKHYLLHKRTYRICCDLDIVTFLPPLPGIFVHVGRSLWLHNERIYENTHPAWRLYRTLLSWIISPISYHYMHKYIRNKDYFDKH